MPAALDAWNARLKTALDEYDREEAARLVAELSGRLLAGEKVEPKPAAAILGELRKKRFFAQMEQLAESLRLAGVDAPRIRRQHAQALIDQGKLPQALETLEPLVALTQGKDPVEYAEAVGLQGRTCKQLYVNAVNADRGALASPVVQRYLQDAIGKYASVFEPAPTELWHGINLAACLARAQRDGLKLAGDHGSPAEIAGRVLAAVEAQGEKANIWDRATALEACVALGKDEAALVWLARYLASDADAFELASTLRQLREVWQLTTDRPPGSNLLPLLEAALLRRQGGGAVTLQARGQRERRPGAAARPSPLKLEKNFGKEGMVSLKWIDAGRARALAVGQVRKDAGPATGSGFLVEARALDPRLGGEVLFLTNAHVVSDDPAVRAKHEALHPSEARVVFEAWEELARTRRVEFKVGELLWTSPPEDLDATLLRLKPDPGKVGSCPAAEVLPPRRPRSRVYVVGYPKGGELSFSLRDNLLLDLDERRLHYRAPTEPGSSGSPVFNDAWSVIGLHHGGALKLARLNGEPGTYSANEGIVFQRIAEAVRALELTPRRAKAGAPARRTAKRPAKRTAKPEVKRTAPRTGKRTGKRPARRSR